MNRETLAPLIFLIALVIASCAKVNTPTGGRKDRTPPVVVNSVPLNGSKNFRKKKLTIEFNKYVVLDNISEKFMVSPPMKKKPKVYIRGKNINVDLVDELKDSTTYTLYFQDAIKDLNEGNILDNYRFVFSTGPIIDSLSVTGNVYSAFNLEAPEKTLALLFSEQADSAVLKHIPEYISRVDKYGYFRIDNVKPGTYKLYALKDEDNSKNYNPKVEAFAFMDSVITVTPEKNYIPPVKDTTTLIKEIIKEKKAAPKGEKKDEKKTPEPIILKGDHRLILFNALRKDHYLTKSSREAKYHLTYILSLPPDSMNFEFEIPGTTKDKYITEESRNRDTINIWLADTVLYSTPLISTIVRYPFTDTLGVLGYKQDTIPMRFTAPRAPRVTKLKIPKYVVENNISGGSLKPGQSIVFKSQTPFREPDTTKIKLYEVIEKEKIKVPYQFQRDTTNLGRYFLKANWVIGKNYLFIAHAGSFGDIFDQKSDSTGMRFAIRDPESLGKLILTIDSCEGPCIIHLLDNTEKILAITKINKDGKVTFPMLESSKYRLRVIYDLNGDGQWTTGDFLVHRQPEPVSYYPDELEIKGGWTVEQPWNISAKNYKEQKLREKPKTK
jgi:hypothetical protein